MIVKVLSRVNGLILYRFDNFVHPPSQQRPHDRPKPVDIMISWEVTRNGARSETSRWVETASGEEDAHHLSNKETESNSDGCQKGGFMLLSRKHEDGEYEETGEEHLDKHTAGDAGTGTKRGGDVQGPGEDGGDDGCTADSREHLGDKA